MADAIASSTIVNKQISNRATVKFATIKRSFPGLDINDITPSY